MSEEFLTSTGQEMNKERKFSCVIKDRSIPKIELKWHKKDVTFSVPNLHKSLIVLVL